MKNTFTPQGMNAAISSIDLTPIMLTVSKKQGWNDEVSQLMEIAYKGYLHLCKTFPEQTFVPTPAMDEVWHTHMLDSIKYMQDCDNTIGSYLHHFPYFGIRSDEDRLLMEATFNSTVEAFQKELGIDLHALHAEASKLLGKSISSEGITCTGHNCGNSISSEGMTCTGHNCGNSIEMASLESKDMVNRQIAA